MSADWPPSLIAGQVQVWSIDLCQAASPEAEYLRTLSPDEVKRAARLRAGQVRMQFVVGRACLRRLLGAALRVAAQEVPIVVGRYGKPELEGELRGRVHFNVAHTRSTILVALSLAGPVGAGALGIDVESLDRETDVLEVARHSLTDRETSALRAIDDIEERHRAFFRCWTRKEAVVKADGRGLSLPLTSFEVPMAGPCRWVSIPVPSAGGDGPTRYFVNDIALHGQTACALAIADQPADIELLAFPMPSLTAPK